jgi:hypothetical protein
VQMDSEDLGLPGSFVAHNLGTKLPPKQSLLQAARTRSYEKQLSTLSNLVARKKSNSMSNLAQARVLSSSSVASASSGKGILKVLQPSRSLPMLSSFASKSSLTSIPEGDNENEDDEEDTPEADKSDVRNGSQQSEEQSKNLRWGGVEEYCPNDDTDSRASSGKTDLESSSEEEEDDGWGWYEADPGANAAQGDKERRASRTDSVLTDNGPRTSKERKPLVRVVSQSTPLDPETDSKQNAKASSGSASNASGGGSLLLLGSDQWPERRTRRRRTAKKSDFVTQNSGSGKYEDSSSNYLLESLVLETRSKGYPITMSAFLIFSRGAATGFALRAVPNYFLRIALWFYGQHAPSNGKESLRTGLFLGLSMATYHVMAMNNVAVESKDDADESEDETGIRKDSWIGVTAAMMTPLLLILPSKSRLSMALFVAARATEAVINGLLFRLSRSLREQLPVSKWLFALGSAQVVFTWLFHRSALPTELATFLDKASSFRPDARLVELLQNPNKANYDEALKVVQGVVYSAEGESLIKRVLLGSGLIELIASDVFSAATLFGPVFAFPHEFSSSLGRGARSAAVLVADAMLSGFALVSLSRLLRRVAPANGWWAGFVAGLVAIQGEALESRRVEIALFALTYAIRAMYNIAASRQVIPARVQFGEFGLYFVSLLVVLKAATIAPAKRLSDSEEVNRRKRHKRMLVLGSTFRTMIKRCIIPG